MRDIIDLGGYRWVELTTEDEAFEELMRMRHAVVYFFSADQKREGPGANYYSLRSSVTTGKDEQRSLVTIRVPVDPSAQSLNWMAGIVAVGQRNGNPYPEFAEQIKALGEAIGVDLSQPFYPYSRLQASDDGAEEPGVPAAP